MWIYHFYFPYQRPKTFRNCCDIFFVTFQPLAVAPSVRFPGRVDIYNIMYISYSIYVTQYTQERRMRPSSRCDSPPTHVTNDEWFAEFLYENRKFQTMRSTCGCYRMTWLYNIRWKCGIAHDVSCHTRDAVWWPLRLQTTPRAAYAAHIMHIVFKR